MTGDWFGIWLSFAMGVGTGQLFGVYVFGVKQSAADWGLILASFIMAIINGIAKFT